MIRRRPPGHSSIYPGKCRTEGRWRIGEGLLVEAVTAHRAVGRLGSVHYRRFGFVRRLRIRSTQGYLAKIGVFGQVKVAGQAIRSLNRQRLGVDKRAQ